VETVAIDWAHVGPGGGGEEISQLVSASLAGHEAGNISPRELDTTVFDGYMLGLGDVGWTGDRRIIRLAYAMTSALHWGLGAPPLLLARDEAWQHRLVERTGLSIEQIMEQRGALTYFLLDMADEARSLLNVTAR